MRLYSRQTRLFIIIYNFFPFYSSVLSSHTELRCHRRTNEGGCSANFDRVHSSTLKFIKCTCYFVLKRRIKWVPIADNANGVFKNPILPNEINPSICPFDYHFNIFIYKEKTTHSIVLFRRRASVTFSCVCYRKPPSPLSPLVYTWKKCHKILWLTSQIWYVIVRVFACVSGGVEEDV